MLTDEQTQWLVPVFKEAYSILDRIPDLSPVYRRDSQVNEDFFKHTDCDCEYFYEKDCGLLRVLYLEHNCKNYNFYGKPKKEIVWHIVDDIIIQENLEYVHLKIAKECKKRNLNEDLFFWPLFLHYANERLEIHYGIVDPYLNSIEDSPLPQNSIEMESIPFEKEPRQDGFNVRINDERIYVYIHFFHVHYYSRCMLHLYTKNHDEIKSFLIDKPHSLIDITAFFSETEYISLTADNEILEKQHLKDYWDYSEFLKVIENKKSSLLVRMKKYLISYLIKWYIIFKKVTSLIFLK